MFDTKGQGLSVSVNAAMAGENVSIEHVDNGQRGNGAGPFRSVIKDSASFDPNDLSHEQLASVITEALDGIQFLETEVAGWVQNLADRGGHVDLGYPSPTALLMNLGRMSAGHAKQVVARANASETAPVAFQAWADGRLSTDQTRYVFSLAESVPDVFSEAEERLVEIIEPLSVRDTARALEYWRQSVDGPGDLDPDVQLARRGFSLSKTMGGMRRVDGWLTAVAGEALETALDALMVPPGAGETRTTRQRRHDALEDLARDWLEHGDTPVVGGEKPTISVIGDLPALQGIAGGVHETLNGDIIDVDTLRMLACDASVSRIVLGPDSEILDVGRRTRVWSPAQRRAIIARDKHCTWESGCDRSARWCDIHHSKLHWTDGGHTSVENGRLLCRFHHTLEHLKDRRRRRSRR